MPPNLRGGKGYKKKKNGGGGTFEPEYIEREADQFPARAIRLLGNLNVLCYCNDNRLRICKIRGAMVKKKIYVNPGDVVLISYRSEFGVSQADKGDVVARYAPEHLSRLRKEPGVNQRVFMKLETMNGMTLAEVGMDKTNDTAIQEAPEGDDLFESEGSDEEDEGGEKDAKPTKPKEKDHRAPRPEEEDDGPIDVDAI